MRPMPLLNAVKVRVWSAASNFVSVENVDPLIYGNAYSQLIVWTENRIGRVSDQISDHIWEHIQDYC